jgi:hypothetical protein
VPSRVLALVALLLAVTACGDDGTTRPAVLDTYAYEDSGHQRVACCLARDGDRSASAEYPLAGVSWWGDGSWHEAQDQPISCVHPGRRNEVRIGYVRTAVTDDAPGTTVIAWLRCPT